MNWNCGDRVEGYKVMKGLCVVLGEGNVVWCEIGDVI